MTNPNTSHITLVADRSGSMQAIRSDAEGAVNAFITDQAKEPGECSLLLVEFDSPHNADGIPSWYNVVHDGDIQEAPIYSLHPRGATALFDAIGRALTDTGERLASLPESERPSHVFFVVQTDGMENASREWKLAQLVDSIKVQENQFSWTFIFLGTGPTAWASADLFVGTKMHLNTMRSGAGGQSMAGSYRTVGLSIAQTRAGVQNVTYGGTIDDDGNEVTP